MHIIRPMNTLDIDRVHEIEKSAHRAPWSRDILRDCVLVGYDCRVLEQIDFRGKHIEGYIISRLSEREYHILNLCISEKQQRKGLGKFILKTVLASLNSGGLADSVMLEVRPTNQAAISLYEKFGFVHSGMKRNYYKDTNGTEDALVLRKVL